MYLLASGIKNKGRATGKASPPASPDTPSHLRNGLSDYAITPPRIFWQEGSHPDPPQHRRRYLEDDTSDIYDESMSIASGVTQTWASEVGPAARPKVSCRVAPSLRALPMAQSLAPASVDSASVASAWSSENLGLGLAVAAAAVAGVAATWSFMS